VDKRIEPKAPKKAPANAPSRLKKAGISAAARLGFYILLAAAAVLVVKYRNSIADSRIWKTVFEGDPAAQVEPAAVIETGAGAESVVAAIDDGLCVLSPDGLRVYDLSGAQQLYIPGELENPAIMTSGNCALCYDLGGTFYALSIRFSMAAGGIAADAVTDGYVTENGAFCLASREPGYRSVVTVFNARGKQTYKWYSARRYIVCAALSPDGGSLACAGLSAEDGDIVSSLLFFDTGSEQALSTLDFRGRCALDLMWIGTDGPCAVFSDGAEFFTADGTEQGSFSFRGYFLRGFAAGGDFASIALAAHGTGGDCTLYSVDVTGEAPASKSLPAGPIHLDARGDYVAVCARDGAAVYTKTLETYNRYADRTQIRLALAREDGTAFLVGDRSVELGNSR